jgi:hypothetical protein
VFWVAASATPLPRFARSCGLVAMTVIQNAVISERSAGLQNAVIANEVKQSSKTKMHFG